MPFPIYTYSSVYLNIYHMVPLSLPPPYTHIFDSLLVYIYIYHRVPLPPPTPYMHIFISLLVYISQGAIASSYSLYTHIRQFTCIYTTRCHCLLLLPIYTYSSVYLYIYITRCHCLANKQTQTAPASFPVMRRWHLFSISALVDGGV